MKLNLKNIPAGTRWLSRYDFLLLLMICQYCEENNVTAINAHSIRQYFRDNGLYLETSTIIKKCNWLAKEQFLVKHMPFVFSINPIIATLELQEHEQLHI